jgi:hypothetical protein
MMDSMGHDLTMDFNVVGQWPLTLGFCWPLKKNPNLCNGLVFVGCYVFS